MKKEVLKYNNTTGKFQKGDTSGSLTKFKNDEVLVGPVNDKIKVRQSNTKNLRVREILRQRLNEGGQSGKQLLRG